MCYTTKKWKTKFLWKYWRKKNVTNSKTFYKTVKRFISNKCCSSENMNLLKGDDTISDKGQFTSIFNKFFANVIKNLNIMVNEDMLCDTNKIDHTVLKPIK